MVSRRGPRSLRSVPAFLLLLPWMLGLAGCGRPASPPEAIAATSVGRIDAASLRFSRRDGASSLTPRAVTVSVKGEMAVLGENGTLDLFSPDGRHRHGLRLPETRKGSPGGNPCFHPDGTLFVADTHYHRILRLDPATGAVLHRFGEYGEEPGQFIYPLAVALRPSPTGAGHEVYVSEYGGEDRIQVFDEQGKLLRSFGHRGSRPGQLDKATGLAFGPDGRLYVADSCNHRVQVFRPDGRVERVLTGSGSAVDSSKGTLRFPHALALQPAGTGLIVWVVEYGSSRITALDGDGVVRFRSTCREDTASPGTPFLELLGPRGIAALPGGGLAVADTGNRRVITLDLPRGRFDLVLLDPRRTAGP